ncbi:MAG: hypothetical protein WC280_00410 [Patescibacteria group bacterium]
MEKKIKKSLKLARQVIRDFEKFEKEDLFRKKMDQIEKIKDEGIKNIEKRKLDFLYTEDKRTYQRAKLFVAEFQKKEEITA